jgi:hypothetical protein
LVDFRAQSERPDIAILQRVDLRRLAAPGWCSKPNGRRPPSRSSTRLGDRLLVTPVPSLGEGVAEAGLAGFPAACDRPGHAGAARRR